MTRLFAGLLVATVLLTAGEAQAQRVLRRGAGMPVASYGAPVNYALVASYAAPVGYSPVASAPTATPPLVSYSYYTRSPLPVRTYVGYGGNDFPFYGVAYGHPYDPWTWPAMSGSYNASLSRYYDPPVK